VQRAVTVRRVRISAAHSGVAPSIVAGHNFFIIVCRHTEDGRFPCISLLPRESANAQCAKARRFAGPREKASSSGSGSAARLFGPIAVTIATRAFGAFAVLISLQKASLVGRSPASCRNPPSSSPAGFLGRRPAPRPNSKLTHIEASELDPLSSRASPVYSRPPARLRTARPLRSQMSPDRSE
jgi:hypothetical protein